MVGEKSALDWITVEGFRSIARIERLRLHPINILIGPNGSGKSNLIGVFSFLNSIRSGDLRNYVSRVGGAEKILHYGSKKTSRLVFHISFQDEKNQYRIELSPDESDNMFPSCETVFFWDKIRPTPYDDNLEPYGSEAGISDPYASNGIALHVQAHLKHWRIFHFHDTGRASTMKKTSDINDNRILRSDASNLASFLYYLRQKHTHSYGMIRKTVQLVAPFFEDFQLEPTALNEDRIRLEWRHRGSEAYFNASSLSDGTLRFMALATLLLQPSSLRPSVIMMDEPELGLHPYAITLLSSMIRQAAMDTKVIIATQSSLLLDHFDPEDVLVTDRVDGATRLTRLDPDLLKDWLMEYSLGQLWEKNELGGRPAPES